MFDPYMGENVEFHGSGLMAFPLVTLKKGMNQACYVPGQKAHTSGESGDELTMCICCCWGEVD